MKIINDQFYTKKDVATQCIKELRKIIATSSFSTIIEPSAGEGNFSKQIKNCIAFDLDPKDKSIKKQDFLKLKFNNKWGNKILFIGNPPFGKRSSLAKAFIKKCIELNADTIALILPNIFKKPINQKYNLFPQDWKLVKIIDLPFESFYICSPTFYQDYHVPCSFFIWSKNEKFKNIQDLRNIEKLPQPKEWSFLNRGSKDADFSINGNSGKIKSLDQITNSKAEHYIKVNTSLISVEECKKQFQTLKYSKQSSVNGGNYWINRQDILTAWYKAKSAK